MKLKKKYKETINELEKIIKNKEKNLNEAKRTILLKENKGRKIDKIIQEKIDHWFQEKEEDIKDKFFKLYNEKFNFNLDKSDINDKDKSEFSIFSKLYMFSNFFRKQYNKIFIYDYECKRIFSKKKFSNSMVIVDVTVDDITKLINYDDIKYHYYKKYKKIYKNKYEYLGIFKRLDIKIFRENNTISVINRKKDLYDEKRVYKPLKKEFINSEELFNLIEFTNNS